MTGNYTGLLTIALPPGIDEKDRMRVYRPAQRQSVVGYKSQTIALD